MEASVQIASRSTGQLATWHPTLFVIARGALNPSTSDTILCRHITCCILSVESAYRHSNPVRSHLESIPLDLQAYRPAFVALTKSFGGYIRPRLTGAVHSRPPLHEPDKQV